MPIHHFSRRLRACVLLWLLMAMAVAMAAPLVYDGPLDLVCSSAGQMKLVQVGVDTEPGAAPTLDCPNCLHLGPLPDCLSPACARLDASAALPQPSQSADPPRFDSVPPPARGPP